MSSTKSYWFRFLFSLFFSREPNRDLFVINRVFFHNLLFADGFRGSKGFINWALHFCIGIACITSIKHRNKNIYKNKKKRKFYLPYRVCERGKGIRWLGFGEWGFSPGERLRERGEWRLGESKWDVGVSEGTKRKRINSIRSGVKVAFYTLQSNQSHFLYFCKLRGNVVNTSISLAVPVCLLKLNLSVPI